MYDLAIIGAGTAGLSAAIYAARAGLIFTVLEQDGIGGGQITSAHTVENYPGCPKINGGELGEIFKQQAVSLGAKIKFAIVNEITDCGEYKEISIKNSQSIRAKGVIVATGAAPRKLGSEGEDKFTGRGVSYCAVCDGAFFADKDVFVIGGGDTAVEDAIYLASICKTVTIVLRRDEFRASPRRVSHMLSLPNIEVRYKETLAEIKGDKLVKSAVLRSVETGELTEHKADGIFVAVGVEPETDFLKNLPIEFEDGYIVADETCKTSVDGIYAAGDIRKKPLRQLITAAADGAVAATAAAQYVNMRR